MALTAIYDSTTGRIKSNVDVPDGALVDQWDPLTEGVWGYYIDPAARYIKIELNTPGPGQTTYTDTARPASSAAYSGAATLDNNGTDTGTITPIASAAVVTVYGIDFGGTYFLLQTYDPWGADNTLTFTSTIPGDYLVKIEKFPDLDKEIRIVVRVL